MEYYFESYLKITPSFSYTYEKCLNPNPRKKSWQYDKQKEELIEFNASLANLNNNKQNGLMSKKAAMRIEQAVEWLMHIKKKSYSKTKSGKYWKYDIGFLTLTLPAKQMHSDQFVKSKMLNQFLTEMKQKCNLQNYIWRAEKQKNGNIHFHILIDRFISHIAIRSVWNRILKKEGYIKRYSENMYEFYKDGFKLNSNWSTDEKKQRKSFVSGFSNNFENPNTIDIHSLNLVGKVKNYISKYVCKNEDIITDADGVKSCPENLKVNGNLWYISQNLSKLNSLVVPIVDDLRNCLESLKTSFSALFDKKEFCEIIKIDFDFINKFKLFPIQTFINAHIYRFYQLLYKNQTSISF